MFGPTLSNLALSPEVFKLIVGDLRARYGIEIGNVQMGYATLNGHLPGIGGSYRRETTQMDRKHLLRKLSQLSASAQKTRHLLREFSGGIRRWETRPP